ncbi:hypothetical protein BS47DRAFT_1259305, partial [Hydnum rufescens UP504]
CACNIATTQLVKCGLFPCTPVHPMLAINIDMLEFAAGLFVHLSPNECAWASNLSGFLRKCGYLLHTSDSLQHHFANSLAQY